tara:strand:+ start:246 stop:689 length:444 start_codon:yes stop_codon:yes gene_type:complete
MAILDTVRKPYIQDRDTNVFVGIDYPFNRSEGPEGWFKSTPTTIEAVKNNIRLLLSTEKNERLMQPNLGLGLRRFLFEQFNNETVLAVQNEIADTVGLWLPFVEIRDIEVTMNEGGPVGNNTMTINVLFNIIRNSNTVESVQIEIGD